jgi:uncharacterized Fe-S cluster protein YjdI
MSMETVRGKSGVVHFDGQRCIHSRNCVLDRPDVFVPNVQGDRIHPDRATPASSPHWLGTARAVPSASSRWTVLSENPRPW